MEKIKNFLTGLKKITIKLRLAFFYNSVKEKVKKIEEKLALAENPHANDWHEYTSNHRYTHWLLWSVALFILIGLIWAHFAILDEVTVGTGKVIPSSQLQVIQNLEGGIVKQIFVKEGDIVQKDQILVQLDQARFASSYQEGIAKEDSLKLQIERLSAEVDNRPFTPSKDFVDSEPDIVKREQSLYESRRAQLSELQQNEKLMQQQIEMMQPLVKQGAASKIELLRLQQSLNDMQGKINSFDSDTLDQLTKAKADLAALQKSILADQDRLNRTTIRSPVKGIVKQVKVTTVGGVIQPGMELMDIVPVDDTLLIEAKIRPSDIGFIRPGLPTTVKITAYDYSIYGGLPGVVEQISADTIIDEKDQKQQSYYLIRVRTQKNYLGTAQKPLYIIPGMMATVDILTGHKSVLHYLLKPIIKAKENALRER